MIQKTSPAQSTSVFNHLLDITSLTDSALTDLFKLAQFFLNQLQQGRKHYSILQQATLINCFYEPSTRTCTSFELAAKHLGAQVVNLHIPTSSVNKGESIADTLETLSALYTDLLVIRHSENHIAHQLAEKITYNPFCPMHIINAGTGTQAHPTQALLDAFTIKQHFNDFSSLRIAIIGDSLHSRVARSNVELLTQLGVSDIRLIGPDALLAKDLAHANLSFYTDLMTGLKDIDVILLLRIQKERMAQALIPSETDYFKTYGLTAEKLKKTSPKAVILHPGPINRNVEIDSDLANSPQSLILQQVSNGLAMRMAIMAHLMNINEETLKQNV